MKCFGYYIVKPVEKPDYVKLDVDHILSVGEFVNDLFPELFLRLKESDYKRIIKS